MELSFEGANCIVVATKKAKLVIDDNLAALGKTGIASKADIALFSHESLKKGVKTGDAFVVDGPGEYEIKEVSIHGFPARAHMGEEDDQSATIYRIAVSGTMIASVGHIYPDLKSEQLEGLGMIDILLIPVGGNGYTLDAQGAVKVIKKIDPKIVIPTHYDEKGINFEVPQADLDLFLKELGTTAEKMDKLKIKSGIVPDTLTVYQLTH